MIEPKISVIVPSYGRPDILDECIESLLAQDYHRFEIILVSDGDQRPVYEDDAIRVIHSDEPRGSPTAKNDGIEAATGEILIFIDDDTLPQSRGWLSQYANEFEMADTKVGGIGGYIDEPNPFAGSNEMGRIKRNSLGFYKVISNFEGSERKEVDHLKSCNFAIRATVFEDLNPPYFSPLFKRNAHREETDLSIRVRRQGYTLLYTPKCKVRHRKAETGGQRKIKNGSVFDGLNSAYWSGRNEAVFFRRHFHTGNFSTAMFVVQEALTHRSRPLKQLAKLSGVIRELINQESRVSSVIL